MYYFEENMTSILLLVFTVRKRSPEGLIGSNKSEKLLPVHPVEESFGHRLHHASPTRMVPV